MSILKTISRKIVYPSVTLFGIEKVFSSLSKNNKLIIVYHGVVDKPNHQVSVGPISTQQFLHHLAYFKQNFEVVSLVDIFKMYRDNFKPARKTISITFDDGYENNFTNAFPLLKQYNFPSTMFIISNCIDDDNMITWYDYIDFIKNDLNLSAITYPMQFQNIGELKSHIKTLNMDERNKLFNEIGKQVNINNYVEEFPRSYWKLMNKEQLRQLASSGLVEIAAHTHYHPNLGEISLADAQQEVTLCKQTLENLLQKEISSIAFPDGSYTADVKRVCRESGYKNLLAVDYRCAGDKEDKNILPRYCISSTTTYSANIIQVNRNFKNYGF